MRFFSIPGLILLWVVVHQVAPKEKQVFSLASLVLMTIFATLISVNRYTALTVVSQAMRMGKQMVWSGSFRMAGLRS